MKALDLKSRMGMLTGSEKEKYDRQFIPKLKTVEESEELKAESPSEENTESAAVSEDDAPVIESVDIDERDVNGAESLQEKISKGIRDIFTGKKKEADNDLTKEEEETPAEAVQEEMIKDISSEAEPTNVPELEPEDAIIPPPKTPGTSVFSTIEEKIENVTEQEIQKEEQGNPEEAAEAELPDVVIENVEEEEDVPAVEEETAEAEEIPAVEDETVEAEEIPTVEEVSEPEEIEETVQKKETILPELEIPEAMKNVGMENPLHTEIPKAQNICLPGAEDDDTQDFEFNLEDMILEAATAQGIEIPKEPIVEEKTPVQEVTEEESEDYMTEEDLRSAEEEFLNGPVKKEEPEEEIYDDLDSYEMEDDSYEDFGEEDGYEDEDITELEDEDFFTDQYEETIKPSRSSVKKSESRKERKAELEEEDMEQLLYTVEPKRKERDIIPREKKMTSEEEKLFT